MASLTSWELFHRYRRLVEEGKARGVECPDCETVMITRLGKDDEPALWCHACDSTIQPGLNVVQQLRAVVSEHYL